jgi:predicted nucleic acid-binding protein
VKALIDSSVLIAALVEAHSRHEKAFPWLQSKGAAKYKASLRHTPSRKHTRYSQRCPWPRALPPAAAWALVEHSVLPFVKTIDLSAEEVQRVVQRISRKGLAGGVVNDALIAEAAAKAGADCLVTLNLLDFRRVMKAGGMEVREPQGRGRAEAWA